MKNDDGTCLKLMCAAVTVSTASALLRRFYILVINDKSVQDMALCV